MTAIERRSPPTGSDGPHPPHQTQLKEYALFAPRLGKLLWRLVRDPRVPARSKATLFMVAGYLASPVDIVPDFIPGLGQADDLVLIAFALDQILNRVPEELLREHWDGDEDVLSIVRQILDISTAFVPRWLKRLFAARS
ncbi:MAG: YkvA family protein [Actinomycetota bacterium]|nr:YkvA family protein [Actinomycetota bacterium]